MRHFAASLMAWSAWIGLATTAGLAADPASIEYFEKHIRPILVEKCYECHSVDHEVNGGLSLDSRPGWQQGGDSGAVIVPGHPEQSLLVAALEFSNKNLQMPPDGQLPSEVIERFRNWIAAGAVDPREQGGPPKNASQALPLERANEHWAYRPISQPTLPGNRPTPGGRPTNSQPDMPAGDSAATPSLIDRWLLEKMLEQGLEPAVRASESELVRRLYFDLHGLPPSESELDDYLTSTDPLKYRRLVDHLLASPRFGERMARHWMDVARYAESVTLRGFVLPQAWRYRDYLITAFNDDRSLDKMIIEQLAGDLLEDDQTGDGLDPAQKVVATTFLAMGNTNLEEQDKTQLEMDYIDEQLEVIGKAFMGQTIACARCHDHKFDPIPTRDYYALAGILRSTRAMDHDNVSKWIERPLPLAGEEAERYARWSDELKRLKPYQNELEKRVKRKTNAPPLKTVAVAALPGIVVDDSAAHKVGNWQTSTSVQPYVGDGYLHDQHEKNVAKSLTFEPSHVPAGSYRVRLAYTAAANRSSQTIVRIFSADGEKQVSVNQQQTAPIDSLWIDLGEYRFEKDGQAYVMLSNEGANGHVVADAVQFLPVTQPLASSIASATTDRATGSVAVRVADTVKGADTVGGTDDSTQSGGGNTESKKIEHELKQIQEQVAAIESALATRPKFLGIEEQLPARDIPIHIRGSVHNLGGVVPRGFLQLARLEPQPKFSEQASGRLELAQWLVDDRHPLTARVIANRIWSWIFGAGLVRTVDNFGTTGEPPLHPELLDQLALDLMRNAWSLKRLVRQLVLTDAYQRSTVAAERARELDPENRYFSHAHLKRLPAEAIRDAMLAISGELEVPGSTSTLKPGVKEDYRYQHATNLRSVYLPILRNSLPELFEVFDFPNPSIAQGQRAQSTVAPQALALLNSPWVHQRAEQAAQRLLAEMQLAQEPTALPTDQWDELTNRLFVRCLGRTPTEIERYTTAGFIDQLHQQQRTNHEIVTHLVHGLFASLDFRYLD